MDEMSVCTSSRFSIVASTINLMLKFSTETDLFLIPKDVNSMSFYLMINRLILVLLRGSLASLLRCCSDSDGLLVSLDIAIRESLVKIVTMAISMAATVTSVCVAAIKQSRRLVGFWYRTNIATGKRCTKYCKGLM